MRRLLGGMVAGSVAAIALAVPMAAADEVRSSGCEGWPDLLGGAFPVESTSEAWGGPLELAKGEVLRVQATVTPTSKRQPDHSYAVSGETVKFFMDVDDGRFHHPEKMVAESTVDGLSMTWTVPASGAYSYRILVPSYRSASWNFGCTGIEVLRPYNADSAEGTIYRLYRAYFLREPDQRGFDYWVSAYRNGYPLRAISNDFARSDEFQQRYGRLDDRAFLDLVYANVLGREPDQGGYDYWLDQMRGGMIRGDVMIYFADSAEFRSKTKDGRPPGYA